MNLIFVGPQGSGKGTQAKIISEKLKIAHISTGDLLRNSDGELKEKVNHYVNSGRLIPDELMLEILLKKLNQPECKHGFIIDGFPRNLAQAKMIEGKIKIDKVVEINISDSESIKRIASRRVCPKCKTNYNLATEPKPKNPYFCDTCKEKLFQRDDDNPNAIKKRLEVYHKETEPILEFYKNKLIKIDGTKNIDEISEKILKLI